MNVDTYDLSGTSPRVSRLNNGYYELFSSLCLNEDIDKVFEFFADAHNLNLITPSWLHFQITSSTQIEMSVGATIEYSLRLHGVPVRWTSEIPVWDPPSKFVDKQIRGPYSEWWHEHIFSRLDDSHTIVNDRVLYKVPFGRIVHPLFVKKDLLKIFNFRCQVLKEIFNSQN